MSVYVKDLIRMKVNANVMGVKNLVVVAVEHVVVENYMVDAVGVMNHRQKRVTNVVRKATYS